MKPAPFAYHRARTVDEAVSMLAALGDDGKVLAGGQSLVPLMSMRLAAPANLVDINHIPGLASVEVTDAWVRVGALARHSFLERDEAAYDAIPLLRQGLLNVAHPTIRNRGTTVGSLVHADPAAEMPAVLCLLDGVVELAHANGTREVAAENFFVGPMESALRPGELAVAARFLRPPPNSGSAFVELARRHGDYAICGVGAVVIVDRGSDRGGDRGGDRGSDRGGDNALVAGKVALVSVGLGPVLVDVTPAITAGGHGFDKTSLRDLIDDAIDPEADIHASAEYRRHLAHVLTARALDQATDHAVSNGGKR